MKRFYYLFVLFILSFLSPICKADVNAALNRKAEKEYLIQIRPGNSGRNPYWNGYSPKFLYAPSFDFATIDNAVKYRYTLEQVNGEDAAFCVKIEPNAGRSIVGYVSEGKSWSFDAATPNESLAKVWNDINPSYIHLTVEGIDKNGNVLGKAGERTFLRDFPFKAPFCGKARSYKDAAIKAAMYIHRMPEIQAWKNQKEPDMRYRHNTYACKIISATIRNEVYLARHIPAVREEALEIAKNAASFLISRSQPANAVLAYFPPTFYGNLKASSASWNQGKTMTLEADLVANAFLDLYDVTGDETYKQHSLGILDTYARIQAQDGSFAPKIDFSTGEPVNNAKAMLTQLMNTIRRVKDDYGIDKYDLMLSKCEDWMLRNPLETFDFTGQFEDVNILGLKPYEDLNCSYPAPYAVYLFKYAGKKYLDDAIDITRFVEDQFVHWDCFYDKYGLKTMCPPCVCEQYKYNTPVDASASVVAKAMLAQYQATGDKLALAKALALADQITIVQDNVLGIIPTLWDDIREPKRRHLWINCTMSCIDLFDLLETL